MTVTLNAISTCDYIERFQEAFLNISVDSRRNKFASIVVSGLVLMESSDL